MDRVTVIDDDRVVEIAARVEGERVRLDPAALKDALGWAVHDGLLCTDAVCVPPSPKSRPSGSRHRLRRAWFPSAR